MDRLRGSSQRREDQHEIQIGRLKHDRVRIPRGEDVSRRREWEGASTVWVWLVKCVKGVVGMGKSTLR